MLRRGSVGVFLTVDEAEDFVGELVLGEALGGVDVVRGHEGLDFDEGDEGEEF